jgi:beta-glucosidase
MSFPRDSGHCPLSYAEAPTGRPRERIGVDVGGDNAVDANGQRVFRKFTTACRIEGAHTALYPFGHGLSYTTFAYSDLRVSKQVLHGSHDSLQLSITVRNSGSCAGSEVVQLYLSDPIASRSRPLRELKDFQRITLAAGEAQTLHFTINASALSFFQAPALCEPTPVIEPGSFQLHVGGSSLTALSTGIEWQAE